ncbi:hypothetical protein V6N13_103436 [Hibiscus sabdariffa]|uniref:Uncharacterized protein n=1 Tax=Hibiscus sabdariffa TaxID=183260 RepID=A0ABR2A997_9ROSI
MSHSILFPTASKVASLKLLELDTLVVRRWGFEEIEVVDVAETLFDRQCKKSILFLSNSQSHSGHPQCVCTAVQSCMPLCLGLKSPKLGSHLVFFGFGSRPCWTYPFWRPFARNPKPYKAISTCLHQ